MAGKSQHVVDVTEATFQKDIIEYSLKAPVLVDFWASWCGPCKTLGPILEGLADEMKGAFRLAKVDVDKNPRLAQAFQAQSIPTVVAVFQGAYVDSFVGALPKAEVKRFVESVLQAAGVEAPEAEEAGPPADPEQAERFWRDRVAKDAADGKALLELGRLLMTSGRVDEAEAVLGKIDPKMPEYNAGRAALALKELSGEVAAAGGEAAVRDRLGRDPGDAEAAYLVALAEGARGQFASALGTLVTLVGSAPAELRDRAKKAASMLFEAAGRGDEAIEQLRRKLARLLF